MHPTEKAIRIIFAVLLPLVFVGPGASEMAQWSYPWTDGTGDGGPYAASDVDTVWEYLFAYTAASEGVLKGVLNALAVTGAATPLSINTGAAIVKGKFYKNTASTTLAISTPAGATRIDRVVLRADFAAQTVRLALLAGVEGGGAPALTQTDGTTWEISLAQASITIGGVVTLTDERTYCHFSTEIGAAQIENRTRRFFIEAIDAHNFTTGLAIVRTTRSGPQLDDAALCEAYGHFYLPDDYVSGLVVTPIVYPSATANVYATSYAQHGAVGEAFNIHNDSVGPSAVAVTLNQLSAPHAVTPANVAAGDYFSLAYLRDATNALDTINGPVNFMGWLVSFTADS